MRYINGENGHQRWLRGVITVLICIVLTVGVCTGARALSEMTGEEMEQVSAQEGFNIDVELDLLIDRIAFNDENGGPCSDCAASEGVLQFGSGTDGIVFDDGTGSQASLSNMTIDFDGSNIIGLELPSGTFDLSVDETRLGQNVSGDAGLGFGAHNLSLDGTTVELGTN